MFEIKDGKINTKPFDVSLGSVKMKLGGSTGLDKSIAYAGTVQLPDKLNMGQVFDGKCKNRRNFLQTKNRA